LAGTGLENTARYLVHSHLEVMMSRNIKSVENASNVD